MKNLKFLFLLYGILLLFFELIAYGSVKVLKSSEFIKNKKIISQKINDGYLNNSEKYYFNSYVDHEKYLKILSNKPNLDLERKIFTYISDYNNERLVLFQGDSWNEVVTESEEIFGLIKKFGIKNNISIINGGISSFSLSPIIAQLKILKTYHDIKPKIIILILDQTDLGDDLYRREIFVHRSTKTTVNYSKNVLEIIDSRTFNLIKLFKIFKNHYLYKKEIYGINSIETFKHIINQIYLKITNTPLQLSPLKHGINENQEKYFYKLLNIYFKLANEDIEKLIIVTHPHKIHISNLYKLNLSSLIDKYIRENKLEQKILHINFSNEVIKKNIDVSNFFKKEDIVSHLTTEKFLHYYYPRILSELENTKLLKY